MGQNRAHNIIKGDKKGKPGIGVPNVDKNANTLLIKFDEPQIAKSQLSFS